MTARRRGRVKRRASADVCNTKERVEAEPERADVLRLDRCGEREIEWLWSGLVPLRKVTLLVGDPGVGKSFLALDLAARVTLGETDAGAGATKRGSVLLLTADDDVEDTIVPRLRSAGADLRRVSVLSSLVREAGDERGRLFSLARDLERLRGALSGLDHCRLVVIDPISAYLKGVDGNSNVGVRQVLLELAELARERGVAVLVVSHRRKEWSMVSLHRAMGSVAFTAVARVVLVLVEDPLERGRRLLVPAKMALLPGASGRAFRIDENRLEWEKEAVPLTADELSEVVESEAIVSDRLRVAVGWLKNELLGERVTADEIQQRARAASIPVRLLLRAKTAADVRSVKDGRKNEWYWELPETWACGGLEEGWAEYASRLGAMGGG
jgi:putative DNA primase/helicase